MVYAHYGFDMHDISSLIISVGNDVRAMQSGIEYVLKPDGSRVTKADFYASNTIIAALTKLTPHIPIISEESPTAKNIAAMQHPVRWVTDPLDGTKTYTKGQAGWGVHLALVDNGEPVSGMVYLPTQDDVGVMYFTARDGYAYRQHMGGNLKRITVNQAVTTPKPRLSVAWSAYKQPKTLNDHAYTPVCGVGGARICAAAAGEADMAWMGVDDRPWAFSHWDVAAAHAILKRAGGDLYDVKTGTPITYDNLELAIPSAVAGNASVLRQYGFPIPHNTLAPAARPPKHNL